MTKAEVVAKISERTGLTQKEAYQALEVFLETIKHGLCNGRKVTLVGFGTFVIKERPARAGRNPHSGEIIQIPARSSISFRPGSAFREFVEGD